MENTCKWCQKQLNEKQIRRGTPTCSRSCANFYRYKDVQKEFICQYCGKKYIKKWGGKIGIKYCSTECARKVNFCRPKSEEHRRKIGEAQHHIRIEGSFKCNRCNEVFDSNTSLRAHKAHCQHKILLLECFKCKRIFKGNAALQRHQIWCIENETNIKAREKLKKCVSDSNIRRIKMGDMKIRCQDTSIELKIEKWLKTNNIEYQKQLVITNCNHCFDFYVPQYNLLIETDGDYWHGNTKLFKETAMTRKKLYIDIDYTRKAIEQKYKIIRFWENDINDRFEECIKELLEYGKTGIINPNGLSRKIV